MKLDDFIVRHGRRAKERLEAHERRARVSAPVKSIKRKNGPENIRLEERAGYLQKHARELRNNGADCAEILKELDVTNDQFMEQLDSDRVEKIAHAAAAVPLSRDAQEIKDNKLPRVLMPTDNRLVNQVASEIGKLVGEYLYLRNDVVVRHGFDQQLKRNAFVSLAPQSFVSEVERYITPTKRTAKGIAPHSMSSELSGLLLAARQFREKLRPLSHFNRVRMPVLRTDDTIELLPEGYDSETHTYTDSEVEFDEDMPITEARGVVDDLFGEFNFADGERSRSVAVAALVSGSVTHILPQNSLRPAFIVTKNDVGAGGTTLVDCCLSAYHGNVAATAMPRDSDEMRKLIHSVVKQGDPYILFDNIKGFIGNDVLEGLLSKPYVKNRTLGGNEAPEYPNLATLFFTANGARVTPDMSRRSLFVILQQIERRASDKNWKRPLTAEVFRELRPKILAAMWAFIREWDHKGRPVSKTINPAFPDWSRIVGGVVEAAGYESPLTISEAVDDTDEDAESMKALVELMGHGKKYLARELAVMAQQNELFLGLTIDYEKNHSLRGKFSEILGRFRERPVGEAVFKIEKARGNTRVYSVAKMQAPKMGEGLRSGEAFPVLPPKSHIPNNKKGPQDVNTSPDLNPSPTTQKPQKPTKPSSIKEKTPWSRSRRRNPHPHRGMASS